MLSTLRTYDAMLRKAKAGHVTGGITFGYDSVEVLDASGHSVPQRTSPWPAEHFLGASRTAGLLALLSR